MNALKAAELAEKLTGILNVLDDTVNQENVINSITVLRDQVDIVINREMSECNRKMLIDSLTDSSDAYEKIWFTTRFTGDNTMNLHVTLAKM